MSKDKPDLFCITSDTPDYMRARARLLAEFDTEQDFRAATWILDVPEDGLIVATRGDKFRVWEAGEEITETKIKSLMDRLPQAKTLEELLSPAVPAESDLPKSKWIIFKGGETIPGGKTRRWEVVTREGDIVLGEVKWYGPWRQYTYFAGPNTIYERQCLRDIANFCERQTMTQRAKKSGGVLI